jgi:glutaredoxin
MTLFTKPGCHKCDVIKNGFDLGELGVQVEKLDNAAALAHLAWHELVETAQQVLPILVLDDSSHLAGQLRIERYLKSLKNDN